MLGYSVGRSARAAAVAVAASVTFAAAPVQAQDMANIRGEITAVAGDMLTVMSRDGDSVTITLPEKLRVSGIALAELDSIKAGSYIGTAAMKMKDGTLIAQEVLIFPEPMRGVGEGHRPWDLTDGSTMTNATVDSVVDEVKGRNLTLKYKDGQHTLVVPPGTPIVTIVPADKSELKPGAHIIAFAKKTGSGAYEAARLSVGKDGLVPPM